MSSTIIQSGINNMLFSNLTATSINITQILNDSLDYNRLLEDRYKNEKLLKGLREDAIDQRVDIANEINLITDKIEKLKQQVLELATVFANSSLTSERFEKAKHLFEAGLFQEANAIIQPQEIDSEYRTLMLLTESKKAELEQIEEKKALLAEEYLIKARLTEMNFYNIPDYFSTCERCFLKAFEYSPSFENELSLASFYAGYSRTEEAVKYYNSLRKRNNLPLLRRAIIESDLGDVYLKRDSDRALQCYQNALEICQKLFEEDENKHVFFLADSYSNIARFYNSINQSEHSISLLQKAIALRENYAKINPDHNSYNQAISLTNLGFIYFDSRQFELALSTLEKAVASMDCIKTETEIHILWRKKIYLWIRRIYLSLRKRENAVHYIKKEIALIQQLIVKYPSLQNDLAETYWFMAGLYIDLDNTPEAMTCFRNSLTACRLVRKSKRFMSTQTYLDDYLLKISDSVIKVKEYEFAKELLSEAKNIMETERDEIDQFYFKLFNVRIEKYEKQMGKSET